MFSSFFTNSNIQTIFDSPCHCFARVDGAHIGLPRGQNIGKQDGAPRHRLHAHVGYGKPRFPAFVDRFWSSRIRATVRSFNWILLALLSAYSLMKVGGAVPIWELTRRMTSNTYLDFQRVGRPFPIGTKRLHQTLLFWTLWKSPTFLLIWVLTRLPMKSSEMFLMLSIEPWLVNTIRLISKALPVCSMEFV